MHLLRRVSNVNKGLEVVVFTAIFLQWELCFYVGKIFCDSCKHVVWGWWRDWILEHGDGRPWFSSCACWLVLYCLMWWWYLAWRKSILSLNSSWEFWTFSWCTLYLGNILCATTYWLDSVYFFKLSRRKMEVDDPFS